MPFWTSIKELRKDYIVIKKRPWVRNLFLALVFLSLCCVGGGYYYVFHYTKDLRDINGQPLDLAKPEKSTVKLTSYVYASNGQIIGRFFEQIRDPLKLEEVPQQLQNAMIAAEDKRFYSDYYLLHPGIDPIAIVRAAFGNGLRKLNIKYFKNSGASGIVQQYARLLYADDVPEFRTREQTLRRKIKEARIAIQLVKRYPREEILEGFLNMIYFGHGVNGLAEASQRYFNKDIRKEALLLREIAILVSLNKSPALYCPIFHRPNEFALGKEKYDKELAKEIIRITTARDRYNWVLGRMFDDGYITQGDYESSLFKKDDPYETELLRLKPLKDPRYGYGNRLVKEFMMNQGYDENELSYYGGLRIHTTFDPEIQKIASEEFEKQLKSINQEKLPDDRVNGAYIVIEVKTGRILALSGGNDFNETQYNRVLASRSPGSGFKPFTYAAAMEYFHKDFFDKICNCPFSMRGSGPGKVWAPKNFREDNPVPYGYIDFATGLIRSVNLATLNQARSMDIKLVVLLANTMGVWGNPGIVRDSKGDIWFRKPGYEIRGGLVPLLPTAIGASDVNLLELANAYTVFFRNGMYMRPTLIETVGDTNEEKVLKVEASYQERVLSEDTSTKMLALMRAVTKIGTAKISMRNIEQQVACKTGTSDGPRDVSIWCGTPDMVIGIRFGIDDYRVIELPDYMRRVSGNASMQVSGGWTAGPLMRRIIDRIYEKRQKTDFSPEVESELQRILDRLN